MAAPAGQAHSRHPVRVAGQAGPAGADPHDMLAAQQALLVPVASALRDRMATATGFDRTLLLWRYETASATVRFLDALVLTPPSPPART
jgi:hypothetical protein